MEVTSGALRAMARAMRAVPRPESSKREERGSVMVGTYSRRLTTLQSRGMVGRLAVLTLIVAAMQVNAAPAQTDYPPYDRVSAQAESPSEPPYPGTVFLDPDVITPSDPSSLIDVTYAGRGQRTMFDRRPADWIIINAYLFNARFDDGLNSEIQVNPEFESVPAAQGVADKYARMIGQLPTVLRTRVETVWIHKGEELWGGGNDNILIHVDQYAYDPDFRDFEEEVLIHESGHTSLDPEHVRAPGWLAAQTADGGFISTYARDNPIREDLAESVLPWLAVRYRLDRISSADEHKILNAIPNRLAYFDRAILDRDMYPITERISNSLPLVLGASDSGQQGFVLIRNPSDEDGKVTIHGIDDAGKRFGPATLALAAGHTAAFNSEDLEAGNTDKGLEPGLGDGTGHWRLLLTTELDIEARGYIRTMDGFVTSMYELAREHERMKRRYVVPFFNPASNTKIVSRLRVANPNAVAVDVTLEAWDSHGEEAEEAIEFSVDAGGAVLLSSQQLEAGDADAFTGRLGDGAGKWRFEVSGGGQPLEVMSLLSTGSGHLTNLSR